jgi:hypothetical protein
MTNLYKTEEIKKWEGIERLNSQYSKKKLAFRGQSKFEWKLETGLERAANRFSVGLEKLPPIEKGLVREFERKAYLYLNHPPDEQDVMQWLALMQHHGAPTRLLDWTYSFFIAVFFAIEEVEIEKGKDYAECAVWVIDLDWLRERSISRLPSEKHERIKHDKDLKKPETIKILFDTDCPVRSIYRLNPLQLNQRLILQQGLFLAPGDVSQLFMYNLENLSERNDVMAHLTKIKINVDHYFLEEILDRLYRMNISRATLFPGLDGFSASLKNRNFMKEGIWSKGVGG